MLQQIITPQEKARSLINRFYSVTTHPNSIKQRMETAMQSALIFVEEILNSNHGWNKNTSSFVKFWKEVKECLVNELEYFKNENT